MEIIHKDNTIKIVDNNEIINIINCNTTTKSYSMLLEKDGTIKCSCYNLTKLLKNDPLDKKLSDIITDTEEYKIIRKMMLEVIFTNNRVVNEVIILNRVYNLIITPIFNSKLNLIYLLITGNDITKNKKIEEEINELKIKLEESNSIKSVFLSNVSHELRTPMNAIIGLSDLLNDKYDERFLKSINSNAKHLDELLSNILDYSRIESNDFDLLFENFSINDLFDELFEIFEDVNYKKNLNFVELKFIKNEDKKIISDYLRLKQVIFNLISNSIKFTETGYIRLSYYTEDKYIIFKIEDTGIGIPEDKLRYIFDRFWQLDSSSSKKYKGTGLGLSISKSIIEMLGGEIHVESTLGKGTNFYVKLKIEEIKQDTCDNKNKINFSGKNILIIDELPTDYSLLGIYLKSLNINILYANNGVEGVKIYQKQKQKIDIIIIDINLPDIKISDLIKKLNKIKNTTIITKSDKIGKNKKIKIECSNYHIQKPVNKDKLLLILNNIFRK